jgi:hypothetical protein
MKKAIIVRGLAVTAIAALRRRSRRLIHRASQARGTELQARHHRDLGAVHGSSSICWSRPAQLGAGLHDQLERRQSDPRCPAHAEADKAEGPRVRYTAQRAGRGDDRRRAALEPGPAGISMASPEARRTSLADRSCAVVVFRSSPARPRARASTDPTTPDGSVLKNGFASAVWVAERQLPGPNRRDVHAAAARHRSGRHGDGHRSAEAYSVPLANLVASLLRAANVEVDRQSQPAAQTDFTSLVNRAVAQRVEAVYFASQVASNAQLFAQQLRSRGYSGSVLRTPTGRTTRTPSRSRARTSRRSASTSTTSRSRGRS